MSYALNDFLLTLRFDHMHSYDAVASERLGRNAYQEQYVFVYR